MRKLELDVIDVYYRYVILEMTSREAGTSMGCSKKPVEKVLRKHNWLRTAGETKRLGESGRNSPNYGRRHTEAAKSLMSKARKRYCEEHPPTPMSWGARKRLSVERSGDGNTNWKGGVDITVGWKVWEEWHRESIPVGWIIHHMDGNPRNNAVWNLLAVTRSEHAKIHGFYRNFNKGGV